MGEGGYSSSGQKSQQQEGTERGAEKNICPFSRTPAHTAQRDLLFQQPVYGLFSWDTTPYARTGARCTQNRQTAVLYVTQKVCTSSAQSGILSDSNTLCDAACRTDSLNRSIMAKSIVFAASLARLASQLTVLCASLLPLPREGARGCGRSAGGQAPGWEFARKWVCTIKIIGGPHSKLRRVSICAACSFPCCGVW